MRQLKIFCSSLIAPVFFTMFPHALQMDIGNIIHRNIELYCYRSYCIISYYLISYNIILYYTILYDIILYNIILYYIILYCFMLYCIVSLHIFFLVLALLVLLCLVLFCLFFVLSCFVLFLSFYHNTTSKGNYLNMSLSSISIFSQHTLSDNIIHYF